MFDSKSDVGQRKAAPSAPGAPATTEEAAGPVQLAGAGASAAAAAPLLSFWAEGASSSGGAPLPPPVQAKMEGSFGADFSAVRVHQDGAAAAVGAQAFARGNDLHFAPGQYDAHSAAGQRLLGHELAHVVQQRAGRVSAGQIAKKGGPPVNADPALEAEADAAGERAASGAPAQVQGAGASGGGAAGPLQLKGWRDRLDTVTGSFDRREGEAGHAFERRQVAREDQRTQISAFLEGLPRAEKKRLSKLLSLGKRRRAGAAETERRNAVRTALLAEIARQAEEGGSEAVTRQSLAAFKERIQRLSAEQITEELYHLEWDGAAADEGAEAGDDHQGLVGRDRRGAYLKPEEAQGGSGLGRADAGEPQGAAIDPALLDGETIGPPWSMMRGVGDPADRRPLGEGGNGIVQRVRLKDGRLAVVKRCTFMPQETHRAVTWLGLAGLEKEAALGSALQRVGGAGAANMTQFIAAGLVRSHIPLLNDAMQPCDARGRELAEGQAPHTREVNEAVAVFALADGGDLQHRLRDHGPLTPAEAQRGLRRLAQALATLSKYGMTHGDIAPKNVLIHGGEVLLHDLGEVTDRRGKAGLGGEQRGGGSSGYHAGGGDRELQERASGKMDVWSVGLITLDMLCGLDGNEGADSRYAALRQQDAVDAQIGQDFTVVRDRFAGQPEDLATLTRLEGLVRQMVVLDPRRRAQAATIAAALGNLQGMLQRHASRPEGALNDSRR